MFDIYSCLKPSRTTFHFALLLVSPNSCQRANSWLLISRKGHILSRVIRHLLATWQDSRWRRIFARSFLFKIFPHLCKIPQVKSADGNFLLKERSWESFCHQNTSEKATDSHHQWWSCACVRLEMKLWMTYRFDVTDGRQDIHVDGVKDFWESLGLRTEVMYEDG